MKILSRFKKRGSAIMILHNSSMPHSISVGNTEEQRRAFPNDTICIRLKKEDAISEAQMTAGEALMISGGLAELALKEINEKKKVSKEAP